MEQTTNSIQLNSFSDYDLYQKNPQELALKFKNSYNLNVLPTWPDEKRPGVSN